MSETAAVAGVRDTVGRTWLATRAAVRQPDARLVVAGVTAGYLLAYLYAIGHLAPGTGGYGATVVADPVARFFEPARAPLSFTPVATVRVGPVTYLFSLNTLLGLGVSALVGLNLAVTYLAWTQPAACGIGETSTGVLASVPALLSGTACCGPVALIALGVQVSGALLSVFQFLLPAAAALLLGSLLLVGRTVDADRLRVDGS